MKFSRCRIFVFTAGIFILWVITSSWGFFAHRTINQLAVYQLPESMRRFFYANMDYVVRHSVRADLRRGEDPGEDRKHFINFEAFGDSAAWKLPMSWQDAIRLLPVDSFMKNGYVPYHVMSMKQNLEQAFRARNKDSILFYAADIAHYIADAHVPLHTTLNYDGQLTGQDGLHSLWETMLPEINMELFDLSSQHQARYIRQPREAIWNALRSSHLLLNNMLLAEKVTSRSFTKATKYRSQMRRGKEVQTYTSEFARAFYKVIGATVNQQLLRSSELIADFWYTCWVDAGKPDLQMKRLSDAQETQLKKERRAFRRNTLLDEKLLIAGKRDSIIQQRAQ